MSILLLGQLHRIHVSRRYILLYFKDFPLNQIIELNHVLNHFFIISLFGVLSFQRNETASISAASIVILYIWQLSI